MATPTSHKKNSSGSFHHEYTLQSTASSLTRALLAVKRIMSEARELRDDDSTEYSAGPLEVRDATSEGDTAQPLDSSSQLAS